MRAWMIALALVLSAAAHAGDTLCGANEDADSGTAAGSTDACKVLSNTCNCNQFAQPIQKSNDAQKAEGVCTPGSPLPTQDSETSA